MRLRSFAISLFAALSIQGSALADAPAPAPKWEMFDEEDGVRCFRRDVAGTDIVALRGEGFVAAPITRVARPIRVAAAASSSRGRPGAASTIVS